MPCGKQEKALHWSLSLEECFLAHASLFPPRVSSPGKYQGKSDTRDGRVYVTLAPFENNAQFLGKYGTHYEHSHQSEVQSPGRETPNLPTAKPTSMFFF